MGNQSLGKLNSFISKPCLKKNNVGRWIVFDVNTNFHMKGLIFFQKLMSSDKIENGTNVNLNYTLKGVQVSIKRG